MGIATADVVRDLIASLPPKLGSFNGSQFPLPVAAAVTGKGPLDLRALRERLHKRADGDVRDLLEPLVVAAEAVESVQPDRAQYFLTDATVRDRVFMGCKWRAGWALVLRSRHGPGLIERLRTHGFIVFTDQPGVEEATFIGSRDTSPVYFLQMMVRYAMTWGRIGPGDPHEMGHFLERDMPGLVIVTEDLPPLKYLVTLGLMKLGAPAVVPSTFPFPYGNRVVADTVDEILDRGTRFENLRTRFYADEVIHLPEFCDPAQAQVKFEAAARFGGTPDSFFCVKPGAPGEARWRVEGSGAGDVGMLVEVSEPRFTDDIALTVEGVAIKAISFLKGIRGYESKGSLTVEAADGVTPDWAKAAEAVYWQIRLHFPRIEHMTVSVLLGSAACGRIAAGVRAYKGQRRAAVDAMTEENTDEFVVCTECRPFSLVHTCIVTPDRTPMCSARSYASIKAAALFGSPAVPYKRRSEKHVDLRVVFKKGKALDPARGEYRGANEMYHKLTHGRLRRVFLHSVRGFPHTSCGCFQVLAFWIKEVQGLGVMGRGSKAVAPNGMTWDTLANAAGGKQTDGVMGVSVAYVRSPQFLRGDGGKGNLVWADSALLEKIKDTLPPGQRVATEKDVRTMSELRAFTGRKAPARARPRRRSHKRQPGPAAGTRRHPARAGRRRS